MLAGANKRPHRRDLSPRTSCLHCLVRDFVDEDLFSLVDGLFIHVLEPSRERQKRNCLDSQGGGRGKDQRTAKTILAHRL